MPARYPRISVVRDPALGDALRLAASRLSANTEAGRLRELALLGARALEAPDAQLEQTRQQLRRLGATPARGDLVEVSRKLRGRPLGRPETPSETLEWVRGSR